MSKSLLVLDCEGRAGVRLADLAQLLADWELSLSSDLEEAISRVQTGLHSAVIILEPTSLELESLALASGGDRKIPILVIQNETPKGEVLTYRGSHDELCLCPNQGSAQNLARIISESIKNLQLADKNFELHRKAKQPARNKDASAAILSYTHEINNPLTTILGNTQLLLKHARETNNEKCIEKLLKIEEAVHRIQEASLFFANRV